MIRRPFELMVRTAIGVTACGLVLASASLVHAQVVITEVMYDTDASENIWEWIEVRNTTAAPVDLNGWVFDDDDETSLQSANIASGSGNTIVPAGGVAVLYNASPSGLDFNPTRFTNTWGSPITLIGVNNFTSLANSGDALALWDSLADYQADDLMVMTWHAAVVQQRRHEHQLRHRLSQHDQWPVTRLEGNRQRRRSAAVDGERRRPIRRPHQHAHDHAKSHQQHR